MNGKSAADDEDFNEVSEQMSSIRSEDPDVSSNKGKSPARV